MCAETTETTNRPLLGKASLWFPLMIDAAWECSRIRCWSLALALQEYHVKPSAICLMYFCVVSEPMISTILAMHFQNDIPSPIETAPHHHDREQVEHQHETNQRGTTRQVVPPQDSIESHGKSVEPGPGQLQIAKLNDDVARCSPFHHLVFSSVHTHTYTVYSSK
jgi:hypothetical protein